MTSDTSVLVSSTSGATAETSTWVAAPATASATSKSIFCPTASSRSLTSYLTNPVASTLTEYPANGTSAGAVNTPASLLVRLRVIPFASLEITTLALGTAEPEASRTAPEMLPNPAADCANTLAAQSTSKNRNLIVSTRITVRQSRMGYCNRNYARPKPRVGTRANRPSRCPFP